MRVENPALRKVRALSKLTVENGATEHEAAAAAEAVRRLISEHGLRSTMGSPEGRSHRRSNHHFAPSRRRQTIEPPPIPAMDLNRWAHIQTRKDDDEERNEAPSVLLTSLLFLCKTVAVCAALIGVWMLSRVGAQSTLPGNPNVQWAEPNIAAETPE